MARKTMSNAQRKKLMQEMGIWETYVARKMEERKRIQKDYGVDYSEAQKRAAAIVDQEYKKQLDDMEEAFKTQVKNSPALKKKALATARLSDENNLPDLAKGGNYAADARWVYNNLALDLVDVPTKTAPSRGAVALLKWVKDSPANEADFFKNIWPKLIPTKAALDESERRGKVEDALIEECLEKIAELTDGD